MKPIIKTILWGAVIVYAVLAGITTIGAISSLWHARSEVEIIRLVLMILLVWSPFIIAKIISLMTKKIPQHDDIEQ